MKDRETAFFLLSGKVLDAPFPLNALSAIRAAVDRALASRGVAVVRRVATLESSRFFAAPFFLSAGFEVVPADDEDVQATAELVAALDANAPNAPSEIVFALGVAEPISLLRTLAGRAARRVLLTPRDVSAETRANLDGTLAVCDLLSSVGIDANSLDWSPWRERVGELARAADVSVAFAEVVPAVANADASATVSLAPPAPSDSPDSAVSAPKAARSETSLSPEEARRVYLTPDDGPSPTELDAPQWNAALERLLLETDDLRLPAYWATERIADRFPELPNFFLERRAEFLRLLSPQIIAVEENSTTRLVHRSSPEFRQVSAADAIGSLTFGKAETGDSSKTDATKDDARNSGVGGAGESEREFVAADTFEEVARRAELLREQCKWSADRYYLQQSGANYKESIEPRDQELDRLGREHSTFLWPARRWLTPEQCLQAADCYDVAAKAFALLERVVEAGVDVRFIARVAQVAANSQCLIKSALRSFDLPISVDGVQRDAFNLLSSFRREVGAFVLANMRLTDLLDLSQTAETRDECAALEAEFAELISTVKERRSIEGKIDYHLKKLSSDPTSLYDWNKVVEATTTLCDVFREPPSSLWLRKRLIDWIDKAPEETQTTDAFARVVQEIDLYKWREEEEFRCLPEEISTEISPAIRAVRDRYAGSKVVFIGGTPQDHLQTRWEENWDVRVVWTETDHGDSLDRFDSLLRDEETRLFLIYIPWCSHKHSEEFSARAKSANKDFVRLRKGTNPEQIARAICRQLKLTSDAAF